MRPLHHLATLALASAALTSRASVAAPPPSPPDARALVAEAEQAMKAKHWMDAVAALRKARKIDPSPALDLELGEALAAAGKLTDARRVVARIADGSGGAAPARRAREAAAKALSALTARIPTIEVKAVGPPADKVTVQVDGIDVDSTGAIALNPGGHTVSAAAAGFEGAEKEVHCAEGAHERVELTLVSKATAAAASGEEGKADAPSEHRHGSRAPGLAVVTLGAAGLLTASVFGGIALKAGSDARARCTGNVCPPAASDDVTRARTFGNASTAAFVAGGVFAAAGIVLILVAPGDEAPGSARLAPWIGPGRAGVTGTF